MEIDFFKSIEEALFTVEDRVLRSEALIDLDEIKSVFSLVQEAQEENNNLVKIEIDIDEEILNYLFHMAHKQNITLNKLINNILKEYTNSFGNINDK